MMKTSLYSEAPLWRGTYPAVAGYLQRGNGVTERRRNEEWQGDKWRV